MKGLVLSNISNLYNIELENGEIFNCSAKGKIKSQDLSPVAGDKVQIDIIDDKTKTGIINKIEDRINYIKRPKMSNITQIILVVSMRLPKPDLELLDKQLIYAKINNIDPIILLNKIDLVDSLEVEKIEKVYRKIGYKVLKINAKESGYKDEIKIILKNNITAFSGNSGVGKSTILNTIFENENIIEGQISQKNKRGKNTTTQVKLYKLEKNSYVADTPGFSTFEISEIEAKELSKYYVEFEKFESCMWADCNHIKEKDCKIKENVEKGNIDKQRYERYIKIYDNLKKKEDTKW